ncbi:MAG: hypothetical protein JXX29_04625 [Deltaproteobacteria bacterium]|nr:hypothetical protein [Deltaproteobacteria bacterium]MBN2670930.1 hypothetical protein [Deltaproteobacteria bacterium]
MTDYSWLEQQDTQGRYEFIETRLDTVADKICLLEQIPDVAPALEESQHLLADIEVVARSIDNYRVSSLARAVQLMMRQMITRNHQVIKPSSYAYLIYSMQTLMRLTKISSYSFKTGYEAVDHSYVEAIGAIIDHTDELSQPHMM